ncbi:MAG TPA: type II secretion system F family protein [Chloroflexia bacterium]|nr:type II secretion system F family protein [Chloroflexia bacterium]
MDLTMMLTLAVPAIVALGIFGVFLKMSMPKQNAVSIESRLQAFAERPRSLEELELEAPFKDRVIKPLVGGVTKFFGKLAPSKGMEKMRLQLVLAGNPYNMQVAEFTGLRFMGALVLGGLALALSLLMGAAITMLLLYSMLGVVFGYILPVFWLRGRIKKRQKVILKTLPDAIDLMTISVEAGLAFDGAMQRVADKWNNALSAEFGRALSEMRVGKSKRDALRELVARTGVSDLSTFVASIIQADQLGVSIAKVLRIQSEQMRIRRRQRAEEQAHKAPILMMIPMVFLIFPATYIVILGPAVPKVINGLG